jgi:tRNA(adenine34) deaminase
LQPWNVLWRPDSHRVASVMREWNTSAGRLCWGETCYDGENGILGVTDAGIVLDPYENPLQPHERWMRAALDEARAAFDAGEVPIGAVIVHDEQIVAAAGNQRETLQDPTAHAEMIAITQAAQTLGSWRLLDCVLYVTLEPCPMCAGAIVQARIPMVFYGATDPKAGGCHTLFQITSDVRLNHQAVVMGGILQQESRNLLQEFFAQQRRLGKK